jgi:uncharacterized lipoprotein YmbA
MKKYLLTYVLLILILTACASQPQPTEQSLLPNEDSAPTGSPTELNPAQRAAIAALSKELSLPPGQISVVSTEAVEWPDGCLGVQKVGVMCTQAIVPGYNIVLKADGQEYEFHTNKDGSQVVQAGGSALAGTLEEMVIKQLALNLGLKENAISVVSSSDVEFADACLGVSMQNVKCAQVVTPGKIIVLEADGIEYEYHVSEDGARVQPATLALTWTREGGIAGFCDHMTVFLSGEVYGNQCRSEPDGAMRTFAELLSAKEQQQFFAWFKKFGQVDLDASDPVGVSDRMEVTLSLNGSGKAMPGKPDQQALFLWAQNLFQKLYS